MMRREINISGNVGEAGETLGVAADGGDQGREFAANAGIRH